MTPKIKNIVITALALLVVVLGVVVIRGGKENSQEIAVGGNTNYGGSLTVEDLTTSANTLTGATGAITTIATTTSGSQGTPSYYTKGGVDYADIQQAFTTATSTPCSIANPFVSSTSTLLSYIAQITTGASTFIFDVATGTSAYSATTSSVLIDAKSVAANSPLNLYWTPGVATTTRGTGVLVPDVTTGESPYQISPSNFVNFRIATSASTVSDSYTGTCSATFMKP